MDGEKHQDPPHDAPAHANVVHDVSGTVVQIGRVDRASFQISEPPPEVVPRQLPPKPVWFVNRDAELAVLGAGLERGRTRGRPAVAVLSGPEGIGRTRLGLHWAHQVRDRFADGQLWTDLGSVRRRGGSGISDVVGDFLRALGTDEKWIPPDLAGRVNLFRTRTANRSVLVVIDNAANSAEITPLLPSSGNSAVVVTTHWELDELVADGAEALRLAPLGDEDGVRLLAKFVGEDRTSAEREAAADLVRLCGGLPLALRVIGARLRRRRTQSIAALVRELRADPSLLDRLSMEGKAVVSAACDTSYRDLPEPARRLYRVLGLHPGPRFCREVVVAAVDLPAETVDELLDTLYRSHLVEEDRSGRFRFHHELIRVHAAGRARDEESLDERNRITERIVRWYLRAAAAADLLVMKKRMRRADHSSLVADWMPPFDSATALQWMDDERANLVDAVRVAAKQGWDELVWQLTEALWVLFLHRKHYHDWEETHRLAIEAASRCGNRWAEARMRSQLARALREQKKWAKAHEELSQARSAAEEAGDRQLLASVVEFIGLTHYDQGDYPSALAAFEWSLAVNEELVREKLTNARGVALQTQFIGRTLNQLGEYAAAVEKFERARDLLTELRDDRTRARVLTGLGEVYRNLGRDRDARVVLSEAAETMRRLGAWGYESEALELLVDLPGDDEGRVDNLRRLVEIHASTGSPRTEEYQARLAKITG
ncbi:tetratricopeptide repeat protein [Streptoalloteichus hindustanus]|uniref:Tetratricopeptide repeat-containing protein n=1 Tax=Streptoalloteichus hindustanus TaxID=2017 RepID=A0A1M5Q7A7_STRHI|nr:tetratricopeptide repeat protein [Streptoalloteichus hindustanus]SHH09639.1 Tetratricopeptide repeat-containing protein [Streptoalloteichus hindustanus]